MNDAPPLQFLERGDRRPDQNPDDFVLAHRRADGVDRRDQAAHRPLVDHNQALDTVRWPGRKPMADEIQDAGMFDGPNRRQDIVPGRQPAPRHIGKQFGVAGVQPPGGECIGPGMGEVRQGAGRIDLEPVIQDHFGRSSARCRPTRCRHARRGYARLGHARLGHARCGRRRCRRDRDGAGDARIEGWRFAGKETGKITRRHRPWAVQWLLGIAGLRIIG